MSQVPVAVHASVVVAEPCVDDTLATATVVHVEECRVEQRTRSKALVIGGTGILGLLGEFEEVVVLAESTDPNREGPTKNNILRALDWLAESEPGDSLFFYFKGDAEAVEDDDSDYEDVLEDAAILPSDHWRSGNLMDASLRHHLVEPLKEGVRLTAVFDVRSKRDFKCLLGLPFTLDISKRSWVRGENPTFAKADVLALRGDGITRTFARLCSRQRELIDFARALGAPLTSSQALPDLTQLFELCPRFPNPNSNAKLGHVVTKKRRKRRSRLKGGDPLAAGALLAVGITGSLLGVEF
ncbi:hypothetical protein CTAYLR_000614 [Chrysophaeum taylorii]|uniref:Uncharacterized protein n=1 Tax=Chrysophaeum taylorii TaxID=2483200 RepID=A0AAD7UA92_9STRA|nr:hypothetical protein CTAYLR_000614 [Chrysophaeum taylorii]